MSKADVLNIVDELGVESISKKESVLNLKFQIASRMEYQQASKIMQNKYFTKNIDFFYFILVDYKICETPSGIEWFLNHFEILNIFDIRNTKQLFNKN